VAAAFPTSQTYVALSGSEFGGNQQQTFPTPLIEGLSSDHLTALVNTVSTGAPYMNATSIAEAKQYGYYSIVKLANSGTATALARVMLIVHWAIEREIRCGCSTSLAIDKACTGICRQYACVHNRTHTPRESPV
jgi:hypothetical protein